MPIVTRQRPDISTTAATLFWTRVLKTGDCWRWRSCISKTGYGLVNYQQQTWLAHRFSWWLLVGEIPSGMFLDHICRNRSCVRIDHLRVVTPKQNSIENSTGFAGRNAKKVTCKNGHPFILKTKTGRDCGLCKPSSKKTYKKQDGTYYAQNREYRLAYGKEYYKKKLAVDV